MKSMKIANAPCSWGVLEFGIEGETDNYQKVLDEMTLSGYTGTELGDWGFMPTNPTQLADVLNTRNLSMVGAFVPIDFSNSLAHEPGCEIALKIAGLLNKVAGNDPQIVLSDMNCNNPIRTNYAGRITNDMGLDSSGWKTFSSGVDKVAKIIFEETGLQSVFHHHCAGYVETPDEVERLLELTDPRFVGLCFDTGHFAFGGGDPVVGIQAYSNRIRHVHFKDFDGKMLHKAIDEDWDYFKAINSGIFCELGKGNVDFKAVLNELDAMNYDDWIVVEQDIIPGMGKPFESALRNREFLKSLGI